MKEQSLYINILEHENLEPRKREQWDHSNFYCYVCWPNDFKRTRDQYGRIIADYIWPSDYYETCRILSHTVTDINEVEGL